MTTVSDWTWSQIQGQHQFCRFVILSPDSSKDISYSRQVHDKTVSPYVSLVWKFGQCQLRGQRHWTMVQYWEVRHQ
ncbi:hypothetical protein TNCV_568821 [Trichonephila clavipes]|nr:hypothetical protein TNCV_568821 [Trichonephila clavipes]